MATVDKLGRGQQLSGLPSSPNERVTLAESVRGLALALKSQARRPVLAFFYSYQMKDDTGTDTANKD